MVAQELNNYLQNEHLSSLKENETITDDSSDDASRDILSLTRPQVQKMCKNLGLPAIGTTVVMRERVLKHKTN